MKPTLAMATRNLFVTLAAGTAAVMAGRTVANIMTGRPLTEGVLDSIDSLLTSSAEAAAEGSIVSLAIANSIAGSSDDDISD